MTLWNIDANNKSLNAKLKKYRSGRRVMKMYFRALSALSESDDPAAVGSRKRGRLGSCYSCTITKSHRMIYAVDYGTRTIHVLGLGDHKEVYGRDGKA